MSTERLWSGQSGFAQFAMSQKPTLDICMGHSQYPLIQGGEEHSNIYCMYRLRPPTTHAGGCGEVGMFWGVWVMQDQIWPWWWLTMV